MRTRTLVNTLTQIAIPAEHLQARRPPSQAQSPVEISRPVNFPIRSAVLSNVVDSQESQNRLLAARAFSLTVMLHDLFLQVQIQPSLCLTLLFHTVVAFGHSLLGRLGTNHAKGQRLPMLVSFSSICSLPIPASSTVSFRA